MSEPNEGAAGPPADEPSRRRLRERAADARRRAQELKRQAAERLEQERGRRSSVAAAVETFEHDRRWAGGLLAGGLAFRLFLWMLPFALLVVTTVSFVAELGDQDPAHLARSTGLSAAFAGTVAQAVADSKEARIVLLLLGLYLTYATGKSVVKALAVTHAVAWQLPDRSRARGWRGSLVFSGIAIGLAALQVALRPLSGDGLVTDLVMLLLHTVIFAGVLGAIAVLASRRLPHAEGTAWMAFVPGAAVFAVGITALRLISVLYLAPRLARTPELYGAMGLAAVYLLWLFLLARAIVASAFTNATLWYRAHPEALAGTRVPAPLEPGSGSRASRVEGDPEPMEHPP